MSGAPPLSVVIPHYGDPSPTLELITYLRPQLRPSDEIIVSDDASPTPFPHVDGVTVVHRLTNGGFGSACNSGAACATGELLLFLNSDLEIPGDFLATFLQHAAPWQPCVAGTRQVDPNGEVAWTARRFPHARHHVAEWLTPLAGVRHTTVWHRLVGHDVHAMRSSSTTVTDWVVGSVLLLPTSAFREVGGFDERFFMNSEEVDLQRRLRAVGLPAVFLLEVTVLHESGGSSNPELRRRWLMGGRWRYVRKWGGRASLKAGLLLATVVNFAWNLGRRAAGRDVAPLATASYELSLIREDHRHAV